MSFKGHCKKTLRFNTVLFAVRIANTKEDALGIVGVSQVYVNKDHSKCHLIVTNGKRHGRT